METCKTYLPAALRSPIRGYHSTGSRNDDHVFPVVPDSRQHAGVRRLSSSGRAPEARTHSLGSVSDEKPRRPSHSSPLVTNTEEFSVDYLASLMKEQKQLSMFPKMFVHVDRLLEDEIARVRDVLFQNEFIGSGEMELPEPEGPVVTITEKIYIPIREFPEYNFVGRLLGPRGMTAKQLEQETGCRIMVRGKGSMKDKRKEEANRGRPNWEHLDDDLHVLVQCEDTENRCRVKLFSAMRHIRRLLVPSPDGTDELKRKQLMELAIINGTYRPYHRQPANDTASRILTPVPVVSPVPGSPDGSDRSPSSPGSHFLKNIGCNYTGVSHLYGLGHSLLDPLGFPASSLPNMHPTSPYPSASSLVNSFPNLFARGCALDDGDSVTNAPISHRCSEN